MENVFFNNGQKEVKIKFYFLLFFVFCMLQTFAATETVNSRATGTDIYTGKIISVSDNKWPTIQSSGQYTSIKGTGRIIFGVDEYTSQTMSAYTVKVGLNITWYDDAGTSHVIGSPVELTISYDPSATYMDKSIYMINGAYRVTATVAYYKDGSNVTIPNASLPANIYLEAEQESERYYDFDADYIASTSAYTVGQTYLSASNEEEVSWQVIPGAEEYDLEWTYVNDYDGTSPTSYISSTSSISFSFKDNTTRIRTSDISYKIPMIYEHGYILYRVRGVGRQFDSNTSKYEVITGNWSADPSTTSSLTISALVSGTSSNIHCNFTTASSGHEFDKNWQYSSTFAEEGKKKEVVSYFDGSLRNRQSVTKVNTQNQAIVGETFYDYQGRPAVQALPVPAYIAATANPVEKIQYFEDFNNSDAKVAASASDTQYDRTDFDIDAGGACPPSAGAMAVITGASQYYSSNNNDKDAQQAYVPDAKKYPFTQTIFTPDNTGRVRRLSGVGPDHAINSGHETKYLYNRPLQDELDKLFGSEAGYGIRYKKNTVMDANGQMSISYMDEEGKVVATSLSGNTPSNVGSIGGSTVTANTVYFYHDDADYKQVNREVDNSMIFTYPIIPSVSGTYTFNYNLQVPQFRDTCISDFCYDCVYDLEITIKDECGATVYSISPARKTMGTVDYTCAEDEVTFSNADFEPTFEADLSAGNTYYLEKKLTINEDAINQYLEHYTDTLNNTCIKKLSEFKTDFLSHIDLAGCSISCEDCEDNLNDYYADHQDPRYADPNDALYDATYIYISPDDYQMMLDECTEACRPISVCHTTYNQMLIDMNPGGQYAKYEISPTGVYSASDPLSIFDCNFLPNTAPNCTYTGKYFRNPKFYNDKKHDFITNDVSHPSDIGYYYEADGKTKSKVFLTLVSGVYSPAIDPDYTDHGNHAPGLPDGTDANGIPFVYPHGLRYLPDFIQNFRPSWASSLISFHPEWGYFQWCDDNEDPAYSTYNSLTSQQWDDRLRSIDEFADASTDAVIGLNNTQSDIEDLLGVDPFFQSAKGSASYTVMRDRLRYFVSDPSNPSTTKNAKEVASLIYRCGTKYYDATCTPNFGAGSDATLKDNEWKTYREFYLAKKAELQMQLNHAAAMGTSGNNYSGYYNGCIGASDASFIFAAPSPGFIHFSPSFSGGFYRPQTQPCSYLAYQYYSHKQKRFVDPQDLANQMAGGATSPDEIEKNLQNNIEYKNYLETGQCPSILKLRFLLDKLRADENLGSSSGTDADLFYYPQFTVDLYDQVSSNSHSYTDYHWKGSLSGQTITGGFYDESSLVCPVTLVLSGTYSWTHVNLLTDIHFTGTVSTGVYGFTLKAMVDDDNDANTPDVSATVTGSSCINSTCSYPTTTCKASQTGTDLMSLINAIVADGHFATDLSSSHNLVDVSNPENTFVSASIRAALSVTSSLGLSTTYNSGTNTELITFTGGSSTTCEMLFEFAESGTHPNLNTLDYFVNILPDETNSSVFYMTAHYSDGSAYRVKVTMGLNETTSPCFAVGTCTPIVSNECNTIGGRTLHDLGNFLDELFLLNSSTCIVGGNISGYNSYTDLLKSFVPGENTRITKIELTSSSGTSTAEETSPESSVSACRVNTTKISLRLGSEDGCELTLILPEGYTMENISDLGAITADESVQGAFTVVAIMDDGSHQIIHGTSCFTLENCPDCLNPVYTTVFSEQFEEYDATNAATSSGLNFSNDFNYVGYNQCPYGQYGPNSGESTGLSYNPAFDFSISENTGVSICDRILDHTQGDTKQSKLFLNSTAFALDANYHVLWRTLSGSPVTVLPGKDYEFSAYIRDDGTLTDGSLNVKMEVVDNSSVSYVVADRNLTPLDAPGVTNSWIQVKGKWNSGTATSASLIIKAKTPSTILGVNIYLDDILLATKECSSIGTPPPPPPPPEECEHHLTDIAVTNATHAYEKYIHDISDDFRKRFTDKCKEALEDLTGTNPDKQHHYTLYYYDQAGNLIKTVPPEGVQVVDLPATGSTGAVNKTVINSDRINKTHNFFTDHTLETKYEYNSLNQLVRQSTPDNDKMDRWDLSAGGGSTIPTGVQLKDIQFNGNTGFAVGADSGDGVIYISTDGGETWSPATSIGLSNLIDIAFVSSSVGYAITDNGYLLKTTDAGTNWSTVNLPVQTAFKDIVFISSSVGYIVGNAGTILSTSDGGASWTQVTISGLSTIDLNDIHFANDNTTGIIAGTGGTVLYTTDGGANWNTPATALSSTLVLNDAYAYPVSSGVVDVYVVGRDATSGKIIKGTDIGGTCTWSTTSFASGTEINTISMSTGTDGNFDDSNDIGYAGGKDGIFEVTTDGGANWNTQSITWLSGTTNKNISELSIPDAANFAVSSPTAPYAYAALKNGNVLQYDNASTPKWMEIANTTAASQLNGIFATAGTPTTAYLAGNGGMVTKYDRTSGTTGTFTSLTNTVFPNINGVAVAQDNSGYTYAVGNNATIIKSADNGNTWNYLPSTYSADLFKAYFATSTAGVIVGENTFIATVSGTTVTQRPSSLTTEDLFDVTRQPNFGYYFVVGEDGTVMKSSNTTGTSWSTPVTVGSGAYPWFDIYFEDAYHGYIVGAGGAFAKTIDGGGSWTIYATGTSENLREVYFADDLIGYAFGDNHTIIKTIDGGLNWRIETGTSGSAYTAVAFRSNGQAYITSSANPNLVKLNDQSDDHSSRFLYDRLGRLIISQNTKQFNKSPKAYSYTIYDALGRIAEVGEMASTVDPETLTNYNGIITEADYTSWLATSGNVKSEVTLTAYDIPVSGTPSGFTQNNLRKRVSATYLTKDGTLANYTYATYYSYDVHGNVKELVQDNPLLGAVTASQQYKNIKYEYDLVSGKVNQVMYQQGEADAFYHKYEYDGDNRITNVYTSRDGTVWDKDAKYFYYKHGPLARTEEGDLKVQAMDYAYTLQGWIKGVNSNTLDPSRDIGKDGITGNLYASVQTDIHANIGRDAYGYSLAYYDAVSGSGGNGDDYKKINTGTDYNGVNDFIADVNVSGSPSPGYMTEAPNLFNGNIKRMVTTITDPSSSTPYAGLPQLTAYKYDQLNRISQMKAYRDITLSTNSFGSGSTYDNTYESHMTYDANGNITEMTVNGNVPGSGNVEMDDLQYKYDVDGSGKKRSNKLYHVNDNTSYTTNYTTDIDDQGTFTPAATNNLGIINTNNNYGYDEIGNLARDTKEEIDNIDWTVYGKIKKIVRTSGSTKPDLEFKYDASGNRIMKLVILHDGTDERDYTYYVRDASGNVMATYARKVIPAGGCGAGSLIFDEFKQKEHMIYGSSRLGLQTHVSDDDEVLESKDFCSSGLDSDGEFVNTGTVGSSSFTLDPSFANQKRGKKEYEMSNHLGSVLSTVSDRKIPHTSGGGTIDYYLADVQSTSDYYVFGMEMPGRTFNSDNYRYSFSDKEHDNEIKGNGNSLDYGARIYDPRLGRWLSLDPLMTKYPDWTPYCYAINSPIMWKDLDGRDVIPVAQVTYNGTSKPVYANDLGSTFVGVSTQYNYNQKTSSYDIQVNISIQYSSLFSGPSQFIVDNPGLIEETKAHEEGHFAQIAEVAKTADITITYAGKKYTGKIDEVFNAANKDVTASLNKKYNKQYGSKEELLKAQKQFNTELATAQNGILQSGTDALQVKITEHQVDANGQSQPGIEDDANKRAAATLKTQGRVMKFLSNVKDVKFNGKVLPWKKTDQVKK